VLECLPMDSDLAFELGTAASVPPMETLELPLRICEPVGRALTTVLRTACLLARRRDRASELRTAADAISGEASGALFAY
jgi:hypothetical protein